MSAKASETLARMRSAATAPAPRARQEPAREQARPVRITVDLDATRHRALRAYCLDQRVPASAVVRALLDLLDADPALATVVAERMAADRESQ